MLKTRHELMQARERWAEEQNRLFAESTKRSAEADSAKRKPPRELQLVAPAPQQEEPDAVNNDFERKKRIIKGKLEIERKRELRKLQEGPDKERHAEEITREFNRKVQEEIHKLTERWVHHDEAPLKATKQSRLIERFQNHLNRARVHSNRKLRDGEQLFPQPQELRSGSCMCARCYRLIG